MTKILVIEDEQLVRTNLLERLDAENFDATGAENGLIGLQLAQKYRPDLIICDVMMPELDGYEVLTALRQDPVTATIPFIFLTAKASKVDLRQGMELGADDYLTKPFTKTELLGAIATRLGKQAAVAQQSETALEGLRKSITDALPQELLHPLNEIFDFTQVLIDDHNSVEPQEVLETAQKINASGVRLRRLIENFIMYGQIELLAANSEEVKTLSNCYTFNPSEIVSKVSTQEAKKNYRRADLVLEVVNATVQIAEQDLKKVVEELIDNAFKFSEAGTPVHVKATIDNNVFSLGISNYGRSMTSEQIAGIGAYIQFERRYQQRGLGLGLTIAKRITELHGGKLSIQSTPNSQTTVCVALQCAEDVDPSEV